MVKGNREKKRAAFINEYQRNGKKVFYAIKRVGRKNERCNHTGWAGTQPFPGEPVGSKGCQNSKLTTQSNLWMEYKWRTVSYMTLKLLRKHTCRSICVFLFLSMVNTGTVHLRNVVRGRNHSLCIRPFFYSVNVKRWTTHLYGIFNYKKQPCWPVRGHLVALACLTRFQPWIWTRLETTDWPARVSNLNNTILEQLICGISLLLRIFWLADRGSHPSQRFPSWTLVDLAYDGRNE